MEVLTLGELRARVWGAMGYGSTVCPTDPLYATITEMACESLTEMYAMGDFSWKRGNALVTVAADADYADLPANFDGLYLADIYPPTPKAGMRLLVDSPQFHAERRARQGRTGAPRWAEIQWDDALPAPCAEWAGVAAYAIRQHVTPTEPNGHYYRCTTAGTTAEDEPDWPVDGTTVADGTAVWTDVGAGIPTLARYVLRVTPTADADYTYVLPYRRGAPTLAADLDEPGIPGKLMPFWIAATTLKVVEVARGYEAAAEFRQRVKRIADDVFFAADDVYVPGTPPPASNMDLFRRTASRSMWLR